MRKLQLHLKDIHPAVLSWLKAGLTDRSLPYVTNPYRVKGIASDPHQNRFTRFLGSDEMSMLESALINIRWTEHGCFAEVEISERLAGSMRKDAKIASFYAKGHGTAFNAILKAYIAKKLDSRFAQVPEILYQQEVSGGNITFQNGAKICIGDCPMEASTPTILAPFSVVRYRFELPEDPDSAKMHHEKMEDGDPLVKKHLVVKYKNSEGDMVENKRLNNILTTHYSGRDALKLAGI